MDNINFLAYLLQLCDLGLNLSQTSNDKIMLELQNQDKILNEQTEKYLKQILENQNKIIELLENLGH